MFRMTSVLRRNVFGALASIAAVFCATQSIALTINPGDTVTLDFDVSGLSDQPMTLIQMGVTAQSPGFIAGDTFRLQVEDSATNPL